MHALNLIIDYSESHKVVKITKKTKLMIKS